MNDTKFTPGPWQCYADLPSTDPNWHIVTNTTRMRVVANVHIEPENDMDAANARLIAAAPELFAALVEGRRAIGDHCAPNDCYATGPLTGNPFRDLVQCPACSFIGMFDAVMEKVRGAA